MSDETRYDIIVVAISFFVLCAVMLIWYLVERHAQYLECERICTERHAKVISCRDGCLCNR